MIDFTIKTYKKLLSALISQGYAFQTFSFYLRSPANKVILLRQDVDIRKENSLRFAEIQNEMGIHGTYYFRVVPQSFDENVIRKIADMGHEIGYHYETMDTASEKLNIKSALRQDQCSTWEQLIDGAYKEFCSDLDMFREIVPIETICMQGSPKSKFDNKDIWKKYDYRNLGILGEPYFDIDFNEVAYLTDTGRRWNGSKVSIRDKVNSSFNLNFKSTRKIIDAATKLPEKIMFTFHPQRWTDNPAFWVKELVWQSVKNQGKRLLVSGREGKSN